MSVSFAPIRYPTLDGIVDRRTFLPSRARGRAVLHLGCVDEGLTVARSGTGALLHEELARVATTLIGVDLSETGLAELSELVPGRYVHGDVERLSELGLPSCELVIAAELIEHLPNPGRFLGELRDYLQANDATAVLTTPNAYAWVEHLRYAVRRSELTHPDHLLLYSQATLARTLTAAGLSPLSWRVHAWSREGGGRRSLKNLVDRAVLAWNPWLAPGLVVEVAPAS